MTSSIRNQTILFYSAHNTNISCVTDWNRNASDVYNHTIRNVNQIRSWTFQQLLLSSSIPYIYSCKHLALSIYKHTYIHTYIRLETYSVCKYMNSLSMLVNSVDVNVLVARIHSSLYRNQEINILTILVCWNVWMSYSVLQITNTFTLTTTTDSMNRHVHQSYFSIEIPTTTSLTILFHRCLLNENILMW